MHTTMMAPSSPPKNVAKASFARSRSHSPGGIHGHDPLLTSPTEPASPTASPVIVRRRGRDVGSSANAALRRPQPVKGNRRTKSSDQLPKKSSLLQDYTRGHASVGTYSPTRRRVSGDASDASPYSSSSPHHSPVVMDLPTRKYPKAKPKPGESLDFSGLMSDTSDSTHGDGTGNHHDSFMTMNDDSGQSIEEFIQFRVRNPTAPKQAQPTTAPPPPSQSRPTPSAKQLMMGRNHKALHSIVEEDKAAATPRHSITSISGSAQDFLTNGSSSSNHSTISTTSGGSSRNSSQHSSSMVGSSHHSSSNRGKSPSNHNRNAPKLSLLGKMDDSCTSFADDFEQDFMHDATTKMANVRENASANTTESNNNNNPASLKDLPGLSKIQQQGGGNANNNNNNPRSSIVSLDPQQLYNSNHRRDSMGGSSVTSRRSSLQSARDSVTQRDSVQSGRDSLATYNTRDSLATYDSRGTYTTSRDSMATYNSTTSYGTYGTRDSATTTSHRAPSRESILMGKESALRMRDSLSPPCSPKPPSGGAGGAGGSGDSTTKMPLHPTARLLQAAAKAVEAPPEKQKRGGRRGGRRSIATDSGPSHNHHHNHHHGSNTKGPGLRRTQTADMTGPRSMARNEAMEAMDGSGRITSGGGSTKRGSVRRSKSDEEDITAGAIPKSIELDGSGADVAPTGSSRRGRPLRRSQSSDGAGPLGRMRRAGRRNARDSEGGGAMEDSSRRVPTRTRSTDGSGFSHSVRGRALRRSATQGMTENNNSAMDASEAKRNGFRRSKSSVGGSENGGGGAGSGSGDKGSGGDKERTRSLSPTPRRIHHQTNNDSSFGASHPAMFNASRIRRWDKSEGQNLGLSTTNFGGHEFEKMLKNLT